MPANGESVARVPSLHRAIGRWDLVLMIINSIIGAGIFGLPSKIFALAGVYSIVAFFVCGLAVLVFILCFAEVASRFDKTGGPYLYTLTAFGKLPAFLMGWLLLLSRIFNYATLINLMVTYLSVFSPALNEPLYRILIIVLVTTSLGAINLSGIHNLTRISNVLTVAKLLPLAIFIIAGLFFIDTTAFEFKDPPSASTFSAAVLLLIFAFGGFESVMVNTGEIKKPHKVLPFGLLSATGVVALFYILIQVTCIGNLPSLASSEKPLADAAGSFFGAAGSKFIVIGAFISILGTLNILLLSGSRLPFAFSIEGQFPGVFSFIHPRSGTPTYSILLVTFLSAIVSVVWSFITALAIAVIIRILIYLVVCAALIALRRKNRQQEGFYKLPYGHLVALLGIMICGWLLTAAKMVELRNVALLLAAGLVIYFISSRWNRSS